MLNAIFGSSAQETLLEKSRRIMGDEAAELSDEELECRMTELQHLIDYWMDVYELLGFIT